MKRLTGKVALITGGQKGIGRAIAEAFAAEDAVVAVADLEPPTEEFGVTATRLAAGVQFGEFQVDVADDQSVQQMVDEVVSRFGQVDILVNNAGISQRLPFLQMTSADWDAVLNVNLRGVFLVSRCVVPLMLAAGSGRVINIASQVGQIGAPLLAHYSAAKAGVIGFTKALARELAPDIAVNAIAPGPILTDMTRNRGPEWYRQMEEALPLRRLGTPEEVAPTAVFLASDEAKLYTGQTLGPNSGHVML